MRLEEHLHAGQLQNLGDAFLRIEQFEMIRVATFPIFSRGNFLSRSSEISFNERSPALLIKGTSARSRSRYSAPPSSAWRTASVKAWEADESIRPLMWKTATGTRPWVWEIVISIFVFCLIIPIVPARTIRNVILSLKQAKGNPARSSAMEHVAEADRPVKTTPCCERR